MKKLFTFLLLIISFSSFAQDSTSYKSYRSVWSVIPRFGVGDKQTRSDFTTYGGLGLRREFALFKLLSLNATVSYNSAYGKFGNANLNILGAGAGITFYPFPLIVNIVDKILPKLKRNYSKTNFNDYYIDISSEFNLNHSSYGAAGSIGSLRAEASVGRRKLSNTLFLAPKFGFQTVFFTEPRVGGNRATQFDFFYVGAAIGINPKPKK